MKQFNPFEYVSSKYGAPIGRRGDNLLNFEGVRRIYARHQGGGDGYDKGGAYWGYPSNVWGVWYRHEGGICCAYVRASSRAQAIEKARRGEE